MGTLRGRGKKKRNNGGRHATKRGTRSAINPRWVSPDRYLQPNKIQDELFQALGSATYKLVITTIVKCLLIFLNNLLNQDVNQTLDFFFFLNVARCPNLKGSFPEHLYKNIL